MFKEVARLASEEQLKSMNKHTPIEITTGATDTPVPTVDNWKKHKHTLDIESAKKKYEEMWNRGEFEWNHHFAEPTGKKPINPLRIWQTFIEPLLQSQANEYETQKKEMVGEIKDAFKDQSEIGVNHLFIEIDYVAEKYGVDLSE